MTSTDIITMVVPILMNGLFIFVFQTWFSRKKEAEDRERNFTYEILSQYYRLIQKINNTSNELKMNHKDISQEDFNQYLNNVRDSIWDARCYLEANSLDLDFLRDTYFHIEDAWNHLLNQSYEAQNIGEPELWKSVFSNSYEDFHAVIIIEMKKIRKAMKKRA